ncbi:MAG: patatin-like phospholipase family protein [Chloroflexota bacterium]|nr:patatin-like phospholipase family protein [Chloroflexota bacterium]
MTIAQEEQIGLALSGGGFRASLFHLGGLWRLNEMGKLAEIKAISAVSAGALVAAVLRTRWNKLKFSQATAENFRELIAEPILELCSHNLDVSSAFAGLVVGPNALERRYEELLVGEVTLEQLPSHPQFIFNACHLETESNWSFSRSGVDAGEIGFIEAAGVPLAKVLAASSALPPALAPVRLQIQPKPFSGGRRADPRRGSLPKTVTLADAGLCDGLGLHALRHMKHLLVSDGTRSFKREDIPPWEVWTSRITNPMHTALEQNRQLRVDQLVSDIERREKAGAFWALRTDPREQANHVPFPVSAGWVEYMCAMRTRLAAFTDEEKKQLVNWGYIQCDLAVRNSYNGDLPGPETLPFPEQPFDHEPKVKSRNSRARDDRRLRARSHQVSR